MIGGLRQPLLRQPRREQAHDRGDHRADDRGSALVETVWLGILLMVPMVWFVISVFEVQRGAFAVDAAARAAGRAYVLAPDQFAGAAQAQSIAETVIAEQAGAGVAPPLVSVTCWPNAAQCHSGQSVVRVTITTSVKVPWVPRILGQPAASIGLSATHNVVYGEYVDSTPADASVP